MALSRCLPSVMGHATPMQVRASQRAYFLVVYGISLNEEMPEAARPRKQRYRIDTWNQASPYSCPVTGFLSGMPLPKRGLLDTHNSHMSVIVTSTAAMHWEEK